MGNKQLIDLIPNKVREQWKNEGIYPDQSLYHLFLEKVYKHPQKIAIYSVDEGISYQELNNKVLRIANTLKEKGICRGGVIAYQIENSWKCIALDLAAAALGAIVVPFPLGKDQADIVSILNRSQASVIIIGKEALPLVEEIKEQLHYVQYFYADYHLIDIERSFWHPFSELLNNLPLAEEIYRTVTGDTPARFIISSGTESNPKLVAYTHNALIGGRGQFIVKLAENNSDICALYLVPLGSAFGSSVTAGVIASLGGTLVTIPKFNVDLALEYIKKYQVSHVFGVPTMFQRMLQNENKARELSTSIQVMISGGALIDEATIRRCCDIFDCQFVSLYGSADGINCYTDPKAPIDEIIGHVGRPDRNICDIKIINDQGEMLPLNEIGEVICRGPISPLQYVNAPELDQRYRNQDGWVLTGDLGYLDLQHRLVLCGRKKDMIIRGGLNISPVQIENIITLHPCVLGCACIPVPDSDLGERICICLMQKDGTEKISLYDVRYFLENQGLARNKLPDYLLLKKQLPLNASGKIDKKLIATNIKNKFFEAML